MTEEITGLVYDIQGFSVQDGPGIRTTVFLKGCPLRCPWCHSPESQSFKPQLSWISMRCIGTEVCQERCIKACSKNAIEKGKMGVNTQTQQPIQYIHVNRTLCDDCGECTSVCHPHAIYTCGERYTVEEIMKKVRADKSFFEHSGGGVNLENELPAGHPQVEGGLAVVAIPGARGELPGVHTWSPSFSAFASSVRILPCTRLTVLWTVVRDTPR